MTSRIGSPDTAADIELRECLDSVPTKSFVMIAGAGSGKTTSLVKALAHLEKTKGGAMRRRGQKVACITYTEVAVGEIWGDVGNSPLFHVSTIHSFLWVIIHAFQPDLRSWVAEKIQTKITDTQTRLDKPGTRAATRPQLEADLERYAQQLSALEDVPRFTYGTGSNYAKGVLGHSDILEAGPYLIKNRPLLRSLVAQKFPYIFVDESQDTEPGVVEALKEVAAISGISFCLGFFGDPMQKIYLSGAGAISIGEGWNEITKPENFRCPPAVLNLINKVREEDDGLEQTPGIRTAVNDNAEGTARLFLFSNTADRAVSVGLVRGWLAENNADPLWSDPNEGGDVRLLVLVHRIAARRLGFPDLYAALNDNGSTSLKDGLLEGTAWVLRPIMNLILPLVLSARAHEDFDVISALRNNSPLLSRERLGGQNLAALLGQLQVDVNLLVEMLAEDSSRSIGDFLRHVQSQGLADLDERFMPYLDGTAVEAGNSEYLGVVAFLETPAVQLWGYKKYIEDESPFATHQGIKGAQFQRVLVVLDDEESAYNLFSYSKYFGIEELSDTDKANIAAGKDSVVYRTRRLFYVCCSRAVRDLAVVFFVPNVEAARTAILEKEIFLSENIHAL